MSSSSSLPHSRAHHLQRFATAAGLTACALALAFLTEGRSEAASAAPAAAAGATPVARPPAEAFFAPISFTSPKLSPDGSKLCALTLFDDRHYALTQMDLPSKHTKPLVRSPTLSVVGFWWKSDDLILVLVDDDDNGRRFESLDLRTGKVNDLVELTAYQELELQNELPDDPEQMLFRAIYYRTTTNDIIQVNIRTGKTKKVVSDPGGVSYWITNRKGEALAAWGRQTSGRYPYFLLWRKNATDEWQRIEAPKGKLPEIVPFTLAPDQQRLIIRDYRSSSTPRISYYDPSTGATEEIERPRDVDPGAYQAWGRAEEVAAIVYDSTPRYLHFLNPDAEAAYQWLSKALPDTQINYQSFSRDNTVGLVFASTGRNPGVFCLVNFATKKLTALGTSYPAINPLKTAPSRPFRFTTTDGQAITGDVTLPPGLEKPPVVLVVGPLLDGPRAAGEFDHIAQFFASRGYATARINHRGTERFGHDFTLAGDFQIATGMVRDLTEGLQWLGAQGWVDTKRAAILGQGWGGLTAFQLAAQPGVIRALVNFNTPLDLTSILMTNVSTSNRTEEELVEAAGSKKAAYSYVESIDPLAAAKRFSIPSFHFYASGRGGAAVGKLNSILKDHGLACEIAIGENAVTVKAKELVDWRLDAARFAQAADFLDRSLASAVP